MIGKKRRMERLFVGPEKRCLMTPLDHGAWLGPQKGIDNPKDIVTKVLAGGANALLVTPGFLKQVESVITPDIGICLRVSITCGPSPEGKQEVLAATMETALKMDVDAVALSIFFGRGAEPEMQRTISKYIEEAHRYDMPVLAEMIPAADKMYDIDAIAHVSRLGMEMGADIIKTNYAGDPVAYKHVVSSVGLPIIIAGGENKGGEEGTLEMIRDIVKAGAHGVAIGRRVWQAEDPEGLVRKMKQELFK